MTRKRTKGGETVCTSMSKARGIVVAGIYLAQLVFLYITHNDGLLQQAVMPPEVPVTWHTKVRNATRNFVVVEKGHRLVLRRVLCAAVGQNTREVLMDLDEVLSPLPSLPSETCASPSSNCRWLHS
jgi:hypothetical protein